MQQVGPGAMQQFEVVATGRCSQSCAPPEPSLFGNYALMILNFLHSACLICGLYTKKVIIFCSGNHAQHCAGQELFCPPHFPHTAWATRRPAVTALLLSRKKSSLINLIIAIQHDAVLWFPVASYHMEGKGKSNVLLPLCRKVRWLGWQPPGKSHDSTQRKICSKHSCLLVSKVSPMGDKNKNHSASQVCRFCLRELMGNVTHFWV